MKWKAAIWPVLIVGMLAVTVAGNGYMVYAANRGQAALEPDYYRKAVHWDSTMAQARRNRELAWRLTGSLSPVGELAVRLEEADGRPVDDARIAVEGFAVAFEAGSFEARLEPASSGEYQARVALARPGLHELRFVAERGTQRFTTALRGIPGGPLSVVP